MRTLALICCSALLVLPSRATDTSDGAQTNRNDETNRLMNLQQRDGSWANDNARWLEKDMALVTIYAVLSLEMIWWKL